jgi:hypothetical protein
MMRLLCDMFEWLASFPSAIWWAGGGGLGIKLLDLAELAGTRPANWPNFRDFRYYLLLTIHPLLGMFLVGAYVSSGDSVSAILAVNIGVTAPLIIKAMANKSEGDGPPRVINVPPEA